MSELKDLIQLKNAKLTAWIMAKAAKPEPNVDFAIETTAMAVELAELEGKIADLLIQEGSTEKAMANLMSQASLLMQIQKYEDAKVVLNKAMGLAGTWKLKSWISDQILKCKPI